MVAASRRKRMVAHNMADTPSLLAVMVRGRSFFQEDPLIVLLTMGLHVLPSDNVEVKPRFVVTALISGAQAVLSSTDRIRAAQDVLSREFVDRVLRDVIERCTNRRIRGEAMSRGGSFDRSGAYLELYVGWRKHREVGLASTGRTRAASGTRTRRPSILEPNLVRIMV